MSKVYYILISITILIILLRFNDLKMFFLSDNSNKVNLKEFLGSWQTLIRQETKESDVNIIDLDSSKAFIDSNNDNISVDTKTLIQVNLRGYGVVKNSFISLNTDKYFKAISENFSNSFIKTATEFDTYIEGFAGYIAYKQELKKKHGLVYDIDLSTIEKRMWIMEHFVGSFVFTTSIEKHFELIAQQQKEIEINYEMSKQQHDDPKDSMIDEINVAPGRYNNEYINKHYDDMVNRYQAIFAISVFYKEVFTDARYITAKDEFDIKDSVAMHTKIINYLNNPKVSLGKKLFLAKIMASLSDQFLVYNTVTILNGVRDKTNKKLFHDLYNGSKTLNIHGISKHN